MVEIKTINLGGVNCYLLSSGSNFILVDTGIAGKRSFIVKELEAAGCQPKNLKLIILTHGDIDHIQNAAYLRQKFGAPIAMHRDDAGMVENGNMGWNRKAKPDKILPIGYLIMLLGKISTWFSPANGSEKFSPDLYLEDGQSLSTFGVDASVVHIPGHSKGSIGILFAGGELICGDLLWNMGKPGPHFLVDDQAAATSSVKKLKDLKVRMVYPGHGSPFPLEKLANG